MNNDINIHEVSQLMPTLKLYGVPSSLWKNLPSLSSRRVQSQHQDLLVLQDPGGPKEPLSSKELCILLNSYYRSCPRKVRKSAFVIFSQGLQHNPTSRQAGMCEPLPTCLLIHSLRRATHPSHVACCENLSAAPWVPK